MDSDSDIGVGLAAPSEPDADVLHDSSDDDIAVPLDTGEGDAQAERERQPSKLPKSGSFGGWLVTDSCAEPPGGGDRIYAVGFGEIQWEVEVPPGAWDRTHAAYVGSRYRRAHDDWGFLKYTVKSVLAAFPGDGVELDQDMDVFAETAAEEVLDVVTASGIQVNGGTVRDAMRAASLRIHSVLLVPLVLVTGMLAGIVPALARVVRLGRRLVPDEIVSGHPSRAALVRMRRECAGVRPKKTIGPMTQVEWEKQYNEVLLKLPTLRRSEPGAAHKGELYPKASVRDIDPLVCVRGLGFT